MSEETDAVLQAAMLGMEMAQRYSDAIFEISDALRGATGPEVNRVRFIIASLAADSIAQPARPGS